MAGVETFGNRLSLKNGGNQAVGLAARRDYHSMGNLQDIRETGASVGDLRIAATGPNNGSGILVDYMNKMESALRKPSFSVVLVRCSVQDPIFKLCNPWDIEKYPSHLLGKITPAEFRRNMSTLNDVLLKAFPSFKLKAAAYAISICLFIAILVCIVILPWDFALEAVLVILLPAVGFYVSSDRMMAKLRDCRIKELTKLTQIYSSQYKSKGLEWRFRLGSAIKPQDETENTKAKFVYEETFDLEKASMKNYWIIEIEIVTQASFKSQPTLNTGKLLAVPVTGGGVRKKGMTSSVSTNDISYQKPKEVIDLDSPFSSVSEDNLPVVVQ